MKTARTQLISFSTAFLTVAALSGCSMFDFGSTSPTRNAMPTSPRTAAKPTLPAANPAGDALVSADHAGGSASAGGSMSRSVEFGGTASAGAASAGGSANAATRKSTMPVGLYGDTRRIQDSNLSEGGGNLSQVSFATEGGDYSPDVDRQGRFVVYASTQHRPTFDVYRKAIDGRTTTQLTTDPADDLMPCASPDGKQVAFSSNRNGNWDVFVMSVDGGPPTQVTSDADDEVQATWAPDSRRLAFSRKNGRTETWEIWIVDTSAPAARTFVCEGFLPRWSPDEGQDRLLFQRARQRGSRLYGLWTIELDRGEGKNPTEIVSAKNAAVLQPNWSPDGAQIVFTTVVNPDGNSEWPAQSDIWTVHRDGTNRVSLTNSRFRNMQPAWGIDGRVYFVSNRGGVENIWSVAAPMTPNITAPTSIAKAVAAPMIPTATAPTLAPALADPLAAAEDPTGIDPANGPMP